MDANSAKAQIVLRLPNVEVRTGLARSTIYDRMNPRSKRYDKNFPKPIRLGSSNNAKAVGWLESEISQWMDLCISQGRQQAQ